MHIHLALTKCLVGLVSTIRMLALANRYVALGYLCAKLTAAILAQHSVINCAVAEPILARLGRLHSCPKGTLLHTPIFTKSCLHGFAEEHAAGERIHHTADIFDFLLELRVLVQW